MSDHSLGEAAQTQHFRRLQAFLQVSCGKDSLGLVPNVSKSEDRSTFQIPVNKSTQLCPRRTRGEWEEKRQGGHDFNWLRSGQGKKMVHPHKALRAGLASWIS